MAAEVIQLPRPKYPSPTRIPTAVASLLVGLRGELGRHASVNYSRALPREDVREVRLDGVKGVLVLPMEGFRDGDDLPRAVRKILSPALVKTYLATWTLAQDKRGTGGAFRWNDELIAELLHLELHSSGAGRRRISGKVRDSMHRHLAELESIHVAAGDGDPEPLIKRITHTGERGHTFAHSPLLWSKAVGMGPKDFVQIPIPLLWLAAADIPLGLGLALAWRSQITKALGGEGTYVTTLRQLAEAAGEDVAAGLRRMGSPYWTDLAESIERVSHDALLGYARVAGEGPEAIATLEPSETLKHAYKGLKKSAEEKRDRDREVEIRRLSEPLKRAPIRAKRKGS